MAETILRIDHLSKRFSRRILAVDDLNLEVTRGQVFGLLGPNGSGKTTTLGMLLGVVAKTKGSFSWFDSGEDYTIRKKIGAILEQPNFYPFLSAQQNLVVHGRIKDIAKPDFDGLLKMVGLYERRNDPFRTYSLGMKQRLAIASAMLADPQVLIFDEPTNGLDPQGIAEIRGLITEIQKMDKTIILASHLLDEVQKVCTDFAVLRKGKKIFSGSVADALQDSNVIAVGTNQLSQLETLLGQTKGITRWDRKPDAFYVEVTPQWNVAAFNHHLVTHNIPVHYIQQRRSSLEEKFLEILKENEKPQSVPPPIV